MVLLDKGVGFAGEVERESWVSVWRSVNRAAKGQRVVGGKNR